MSEHTITLHNPQHAHEVWSRAWQWVKARTLQGRPVVLTLAEEKRSSEQNRKLHACLTDIAKQCEWAGRKWNTEVWKRLLTGAWCRAKGEQALMLPALDGAGVEVIYQRTSKLSVSETSDLIDYVQAWGTEQGVEWSDDAQR